jgi:hypothetical protein
MKIATTIARVLPGLRFVVFGSNIFLRFLPMPPQKPSLATDFAKAPRESHYLFVQLRPEPQPDHGRRVSLSNAMKLQSSLRATCALVSAEFN